MMSDSKTFVRVTNKNIYDSIQDLHTKTDNVCKTVEVHEEKISTHRKWLIAITGAFITIATSTIVYAMVS